MIKDCAICGDRMAILDGLASEKTSAHWYDNHQQWYRVNGLAFYLNYYYQTFTILNESRLDLVNQIPSFYAAMSPKEFFAELYALFYDLNDSLWGNIPQSLRDWLFDNVGSPMDMVFSYGNLSDRLYTQAFEIQEAAVI